MSWSFQASGDASERSAEVRTLFEEGVEKLAEAFVRGVVEMGGSVEAMFEDEGVRRSWGVTAVLRSHEERKYLRASIPENFVRKGALVPEPYGNEHYNYSTEMPDIKGEFDLAHGYDPQGGGHVGREALAHDNLSTACWCGPERVTGGLKHRDPQQEYAEEG